MEKVKLIEICNPKQWKTLATGKMMKRGKYPVYGANGIIGYYDRYNHEKETVLITCRGATCGNIHISEEKSYINGNAMALDSLREDICLKKYLFYFLKQYNMKKIISGSAQPQITVQGVKKIEIKLYDLNKQKVVIEELDKVQEIIDIRKKQIEQFDELIKSQFVEMFGDPILNNEKWIMSKWNEVLIIKNGKNQKKVEQENGQYPIYGSGGIMSYANDYICNEDSVIIGRKGNINNPILVRTKFWNVDTAFGLEPCKEKINVEYLYYFCYFYNFEKHNKAVTIPSLTKTDLLNIDIPIPPIELQNKLAEFVKQIDKQKSEMKKSLEEMQLLQESLMNKYFGEM